MTIRIDFIDTPPILNAAPALNVGVRSDDPSKVCISMMREGIGKAAYAYLSADEALSLGVSLIKLNGVLDAMKGDNVRAIGGASGNSGKARS